MLLLTYILAVSITMIALVTLLLTLATVLLVVLRFFIQRTI